MTSPEATKIVVSENERKSYIEVSPPLTEAEFELLGWTGADERLFSDNVSEPQPATRLWRWRSAEVDELEMPMPNTDQFVIRVFAKTVQMIREHNGETVSFTDNTLA